ncbi:MAG TPA: EAL domain-containing protein, partial [Rhodocyclaceae bacterium]|nr:EAL domain-containing protein [Rhodocyclaceae bacterium]
GYRFYTPAMLDLTGERMHTEQGLRRALEANGLVVHYQPQVALADGRIVGVEALVRWPHAEQGMIGPDRFISVAEDTGIIEGLGRWVLRRACMEVAGLSALAGRPMRLAVNVSARQFLRDDFVATVADVLAETGFPGQALELEITESTLQAIERSVGILNALKSLDIAISIDDFGTGYSSLSVLRDLPIDRIKIDRSFIVDLPRNAGGMAIVEAVVALAKSLRMGIIVEGIERAEQAEVLRRLGCDEGQGFLFSLALPYGELTRLLVDKGGRLGFGDGA